MKKESGTLTINLITTVLSMLINYAISFFLTPYIVRVAGSEAYGFVNLTNNMVNYASVVTLALSSVAGRFITICVHKNQKEEANQLFNSVLWSNIILSILIALVFIPIIINVQFFLDVPDGLLSQVKELLVFVLINFLINVIFNVYTVATFLTNTLYLSSIGTCISNVLRVIVLFIMFSLFPTNIMYVGVASCICSAFLAIYNIYLNKKLNMEFEIRLKFFSFKKLIILIKSGVWSSVTKLSQILSDGLDLIICDVAIDATAMGQMSVAYTIPTILGTIIASISNVFSPKQTYFYAIDDTEGIVKQIRLNMKMTGFFISIIFAGYVALGYMFFQLWVPSENIQLIYIISVISISSVLISGVISALNSVFLITDHLKTNSIVWLILSVIDTIIVLVLVYHTNLGVFAIAGVSKIVGSIINMTYVPLYASKCLKIKSSNFYPLIFRYIICSLFLLVIFGGIALLHIGKMNWIILILKILFCGIIGVIFNYFCLLDRDERKHMKNILYTKWGKNNG